QGVYLLVLPGLLEGAGRCVEELRALAFLERPAELVHRAEALVRQGRGPRRDSEPIEDAFEVVLAGEPQALLAIALGAGELVKGEPDFGRFLHAGGRLEGARATLTGLGLLPGRAERRHPPPGLGGISRPPCPLVQLRRPLKGAEEGGIELEGLLG